MASTLDLQLKIALENFLLESLADLPSEMELAAQCTFSARFEKKMRRLIRRARRMEAIRRRQDERERPPEKPYRLSSVKKRLLITAVIMLMMAITMSITAAREAVIKFVMEAYEKFSTMTFPTEPGQTTFESQPSTRDSIQEMLPTVLPEGYTLQDYDITDDVVRIIYSNDNRDVVILERYRSSNMQMQIDTEIITTEGIYVRHAQGVYYSNKDVQCIIWVETPYVYFISGKITKNELINLAESINQ